MNLYTYKVVNKSKEAMVVHFELADVEGEIKVAGGNDIKVPEGDFAEGGLFIEILPEDMQGFNFDVHIDVYSGEEKIETVKTTFVGPMGGGN